MACRHILHATSIPSYIDSGKRIVSPNRSWHRPESLEEIIHFLFPNSHFFFRDT